MLGGGYGGGPAPAWPAPLPLGPKTYVSDVTPRMTAQVVDTVVDQRLHGLSPGGSSTDVVAEVVAAHSAVPFVPGTHPHARCRPPAACPLCTPGLCWQLAVYMNS